MVILGVRSYEEIDQVLEFSIMKANTIQRILKSFRRTKNNKLTTKPSKFPKIDLLSQDVLGRNEFQ